jgi:uncharacterized protein YkwD
MRWGGATFAAAAVLVMLTSGTASARVAADDGIATRQGVVVSQGWRAQMLVGINDLRRSAGVAPLRLCASLTTAARKHAREMATTGVFSHTGAAGDQYWDRIASVGYRVRWAGENLAAGQLTERDALDAWRGSSAHYAVLTNPAFRHVGLAVAVASTGDYPVYWVQDFAAGGRC